MQRSGAANLPLHWGRAPRWLFTRMVPLAGAIAEAVVEDIGRAGFLRRISDPYWFQALSCVLGFDWHSSGTTTTTMGALKQALDPERHGLAVAGGKGRVSRRTPSELCGLGDGLGLRDDRVSSLIRASRLCAKVDSCMVQDGYNLYHHTMVVSEDGDWAVVQQGLDDTSRTARRYHWLSERATDMIEEPHAAICCDSREESVLDMTAHESSSARDVSVDLACEGPSAVLSHLRHPCQSTLDDFSGTAVPELTMPRRHHVVPADLGPGGVETLKRARELAPRSYQELLLIPGMGPRRIRALALVSDLVYGEPPSWRDPARYSYCHGGKDGHPYPVDRRTYDATIRTLEGALETARLGRKERLDALRRLRAATSLAI